MASYTSAQLVNTYYSRNMNVAVLEYLILGAHSPPHPGQFYLVWVPGYEAIPLSIALYKDSTVYFVVKVRGATTKLLVQKPPRHIGLIGPIGKPITLPDSSTRVLLLAGGTGVAPLIYLANILLKVAKEVVLIYGIKSVNEAIPLDKLVKVGERLKVVYASEDGSTGVKGTVLDAVRQLYNNIEEYFDYVYAAGPQPMLCKLYTLLKNRSVKTIFVLETFVRCGLGFCGKCKVPGLNKLLCLEGPSFNIEVLSGWYNEECRGN